VDDGGAPVRYEAKDSVGWITLARPHVLNALDARLAEELADATAKLRLTLGIGETEAPSQAPCGPSRC
jgi:enoyl-CoA hydratase/carnithine racemase